MLQRPFGLLGDIDLSVLEALDQVGRREIDQLDRIGIVENRVRHCLAHTHMRDLRHDVIQALDVLNVDGGVDIDPPPEQFLDIEIALGVAAARRISMSELVHQDDLRPARDDRVDIHFIERLVLVGDTPARDDLHAIQQRLGLAAAVGFDDADHDVIAVFFPGARGLQHLVGLADAGRRTDKDLEFSGAAFLAPGSFQQGVWRRPVLNIAALLGHAGSGSSRVETAIYCAAPRSRARLSASTFTRGSPTKPTRRSSTLSLTSWRTRSSGMLRAFATRGT